MRLAASIDQNTENARVTDDMATRSSVQAEEGGKVVRETVEAMKSIAGKIGCNAETLRNWVRQHERDAGLREGPTTAEQQRVKELEREVRELRKTNEILKLASAYFAQAEFDRQLKK